MCKQCSGDIHLPLFSMENKEIVIAWNVCNENGTLHDSFWKKRFPTESYLSEGIIGSIALPAFGIFSVWIGRSCK